jgi:hypothetical protein
MLRQRRSTKALSRHESFPSMLIETFASGSTPVKSMLVNWLP